MSRKRILVVDDEPSVTRNLKLNLETRAGYQVCAENQADHALAAAQHFRPDLVLLDVMMPGKDGGDVAAQLRSDPLLRDTPIIFLTAIVSNDETDGHAMRSGAETFLAKPVDIAELTRTIDEFLHASRTRQAQPESHVFHRQP